MKKKGCDCKESNIMESGMIPIAIIIIVILLLLGLFNGKKERFWVRPNCRNAKLQNGPGLPQGKHDDRSNKCHYNILLNNKEYKAVKPLYSVPFGYYDPNLPGRT